MISDRETASADEKRDNAIIEEACRRAQGKTFPAVVRVAMQLVREGWTAPDQFALKAQEMFSPVLDWPNNGCGVIEHCLRKGAEMERDQIRKLLLRHDGDHVRCMIEDNCTWGEH